MKILFNQRQCQKKSKTTKQKKAIVIPRSTKSELHTLLRSQEKQYATFLKNCKILKEEPQKKELKQPIDIRI